MKALTIGDKPHKIHKTCPGKDGKPCGRGCYGDICSACKSKDKAVVMRRMEAIMAARAKGMANKLYFRQGQFWIVQNAKGEIYPASFGTVEAQVSEVAIMEVVTLRPGTYDWYRGGELVGRTQSHNIMDDMPVLSKSGDVRIETVREILERNGRA